MTEPGREVVEQAAAWLALLQSPEASEADRAACRAWREQLPAHELAWQRLRLLWQRLDGVEPMPARAAVAAALQAEGAAQARLRRTRVVQRAALGVLLACGACFAMQRVTTAGLLADYRSGVGEVRSFELPDRSRITLDSASSVDLQFDQHQRRVILRRGEVLVEVAADARRPFVVETPQASARALGTRYTVRRDDVREITTVTVLHSAVQACMVLQASRSARCVDLHAGQQTSITASGVAVARSADTEAAEAWTRGWLVVSDASLAEVLEVLQRRRRGAIRYDAAELADLRVSGVFSLQDADRALEVLAGSLPIRVRHYTALLTVVEPESSQ